MGVHEPHYRNFRELMNGGGLSGWLREQGAVVVEERRCDGGTMAVVATREAGPAA